MAKTLTKTAAKTKVKAKTPVKAKAQEIFRKQESPPLLELE